MNTLKGKVSVITGSTRGIGFASAKTFAAEGAAVVVSSRSQSAVDQAVSIIRSAGGNAHGIAADVGKLEDVERLRDAAIETFGRIDIWINNAGISGTYGPTIALTADEFSKVIQTNILGVFYGSRTAVRYFQRQGSGKLINLVGAGAKKPAPNQNAYGSSKAWVRMFTKALAEETKENSIGIFTFQPGLVYTDLLRNVDVIDGYQERLKVFPTVIRLLSKKPEAITPKLVWLASSATDGKTGLEVRAVSTLSMIVGAAKPLMHKPQPPIELNLNVISPAAD